MIDTSNQPRGGRQQARPRASAVSVARPLRLGPCALLALASLSACGGGGGSSTSSGTPVTSLSVAWSQAEAPETQLLLNGTLSLTAPLAQELRVQLSYGGQAAADQDFVALDELMLPAQSLSVPFSLELVNDELDEFPEILELSVASTDAGGDVDLSSATAAITLLDDDEAPRLGFALVGQQASEAGGPSIEVPFELSAPSGKTVQATVTLGGNATLGSDYQFEQDTVSFAPGQVQASLSVQLLADGMDEQAEVVLLELDELTAATPGDLIQHELRIVDWFGPPVLLQGFEPMGFFSLYSATLDEGPTPFVQPPAPSLVKDFLWSPNGDRVAYLVDLDQPGVFDLWTMASEGGDAVRVSDPLVAGGEIDEFAWSADGDRLAYRGDAQIDGVDELFTVPATGGTVQRVSQPSGSDSDVQDFAWSPVDGNRLIYRADATLFDEALYRVRADGSNHARLSPASVSKVTQYAWSPDGDHVAFLGLDLPSYQLYSVPSIGDQGQAVRRTTEMADDGSVEEFAWTPDGTQLVFRAAWASFGVFELVRVPAAVGSAVVLTDLGAGALLDPSWQLSGDGARLAYLAVEEGRPGFELYALELSGGAALRISPALEAFDDATEFAWAPDSSALALRLSRGNGTELYRIDPTGADTPLRLSLDAMDVTAMAWDPLSSRVAFTAISPGSGGEPSLYSADAPPGDELHRISGAPQSGLGVLSFQWAAGGARLIFGRGSGLAADELRSGPPFLDDVSVLLSSSLELVIDFLVW